MIIYKVTNLINNKVYIGKTVHALAVRKANHLYKAKIKKYNSAFHNAIRKYGEDNFVWEIVDKVLFAESLIALEKHYIKLFLSKAPNGYNLTDGGEGVPGFRLPAETRKKMSIAASGKRRSAETRKKMSDSQIGNTHCLGNHHSAETLRKMSLAKKGKRYSVETRERMRLANIGKHASAETKEKMSISRKKYWRDLKDKGQNAYRNRNKSAHIPIKQEVMQ